MRDATAITGAIAATVLVTVFGPIAPGHAATIVWDGDGAPLDGNFSVAANWNPDQVPTVGDEAEFSDNSTYTVTFTQDEASDVLNVLAGTVTFASDSATLRTYDLTTGDADVNVTGGTLNVGAAAGPVLLDLGNDTFIGTSAGDGTLNIQNGGAVSNTDVGTIGNEATAR